MKYTIELPKTTAERLRHYASERQQTPEEAITTLIQRDLQEAQSPQQESQEQPTSDIPVGVNPLAEFFGRYTADVPDITLHHDLYLAEEAIATHDDEHSDD